jgi:hypothetical protein
LPNVSPWQALRLANQLSQYIAYIFHALCKFGNSCCFPNVERSTLPSLAHVRHEARLFCPQKNFGLVKEVDLQVVVAQPKYNCVTRAHPLVNATQTDLEHFVKNCENEICQFSKRQASEYLALELDLAAFPKRLSLPFSILPILAEMFIFDVKTFAEFNRKHLK